MPQKHGTTKILGQYQKTKGSNQRTAYSPRGALDSFGFSCPANWSPPRQPAAQHNRGTSLPGQPVTFNALSHPRMHTQHCRAPLPFAKPAPLGTRSPNPSGPPNTQNSTPQKTQQVDNTQTSPPPTQQTPRMQAWATSARGEKRVHQRPSPAAQPVDKKTQQSAPPNTRGRQCSQAPVLPNGGTLRSVSNTRHQL